MTKIFYVVTDINFFISHRLCLAESAWSRGYDVHIAASNLNENTNLPRKFTYHILPLSNSINLFKELCTCRILYSLMNQIKPDIVHLVGIKPYLLGGIISRFLGIRCVVSAVSGLGTFFISDKFSIKLLRYLLRPFFIQAFRHKNQKIIFQNESDMRQMANYARLDISKISLIHGSGVDLTVFKIKPEPPLDIIKIVMASRLIRDKGVYEFVKAAEIVKSSRNKTEFLLYGSPSPNNPTSLSLEEIEHINKDGKVKILGHTNNVMNAYSEAHIVCLPSYREGLPKSLIEASACGRAIITTDVPGCRDAIIPNVTGLLVAPKDALDLSKKILELVDNHSLRRILGINGRKVAEDKFDIKKVVETHSNIYRQLLEYKEKHFEKSLRD